MAGPLPEQHARILAQKLADGQLALFVGAGLSRQAVAKDGSGRKLPLWKELAKTVAATCHEDLSTYGGNILDLFDAIAFGQSRFELEEAVRRAIDDKRFAPSEAHHALARLPWAGVYTTNYDGLLGRVLNETPIVEEDHYDRLQRPDGERPRLFHVHGTLEKPHTLTRDDYRLWPEKHPRAYRDLEGVILNKTILFVGYSLSDPHFADGLLPMVRKITAGRDKPLYAWMWQMPANQIQLLDRRDRIAAIPLNQDRDYLAAFTQIESFLANPSSNAVHTAHRKFRLTDLKASVGLAAMSALKTVAGEPEMRRALIERLADSDIRVRMQAFRALAGMVGDPKVRAALLTSLDDTDGVVRESAIRALEGALHQGEVKKSISSGLAFDDDARAVALGLLAAAVSGRSDRFGADQSSLLDLAIFKDKDATWCPEMVVIPSGSFLMGSPEDEEGRTETEGPQRQVTIAYRFAIGRYAVTVGEYGQFIKETGRYASGGMRVRVGNEWKYDPSKSWRDPGFPQTERHPVVGVSWELASKYCEWLSQKTGQPYRLPSEAEWEYACRAGTTTPFSFGETITPEQANYDGRRKGTVEVGTLPANPWGLHEMHGNVSEWIEDVIHGSYKDAPSDGYAWTEDNEQVQQRVRRGGAWISNRKDCRSAHRLSNVTEKRIDFIGFRVARSL